MPFCLLNFMLRVPFQFDIMSRGKYICPVMLVAGVYRNHGVEEWKGTV